MLRVSNFPKNHIVTIVTLLLLLHCYIVTLLHCYIVTIVTLLLLLHCYYCYYCSIVTIVTLLLLLLLLHCYYITVTYASNVAMEIPIFLF